MTPEQLRLVRSTLAQATANPRDFGLTFYGLLFEAMPELSGRFQGNLDKEIDKLNGMMSLAFGSLTDVPFLVTTLQGLARRDIGRDLPDAQCRALARTLLGAIEQRLGENFTNEVRNAWIALLTVALAVLRAPVALTPVKPPAAANVRMLPVRPRRVA